MASPEDRTALRFVTVREHLPLKERDALTNRPINRSADDRLQEYHEHRGTLFAIAYRMLGSVADAEDMLQETFIRWQQSAQPDIQSPRAFLITILTRLCINHLESAKVRREQYYGQWLPEPLLTEDTAQPASAGLEMDQSLSLAFLVLLERLSPAERAVLLLREVFDYDYAQIAQILGQTEANCRQLLRRARQHIAGNRPRFDTSRERCEQLLKEFLQVVSGGDLQRLVALLSKEAVLHSDGGGKAPALPVLISGGDKVARALIGAVRKLVPKTLVSRLMLVNGQPGVVSYLQGRAYSVFTLHVVDGRVSTVYIVSNPDKLAHLTPLHAAES